MVAGKCLSNWALPTETVKSFAGRDSGSGTGGSSFPHPDRTVMTAKGMSAFLM
ncbi:hypothetical protein THOG10_20056 [Vibrio rotiferianus]|nr:hypothetical protein THOG10_20056 [Vibrio rotiferianus]